jgi:hypothetical protein
VVTSRRAGGNAFLPELELNVSTELTQAGTGQPGGEAAGGPDGEQLPDPDRRHPPHTPQWHRKRAGRRRTALTAGLWRA